MPFIKPEPSDSAEFIAGVENVAALAVQRQPAYLIIIRVNNWFGERWVGFAGKVLGVAGLTMPDRLVVPPFVPARVLRQTCYGFSAHQRRYVVEECAHDVHVTQPSERNQRRFVDELYPETSLVWFSDRSLENGRGSVMAYVPYEGHHTSWYVEFTAAHAWQPTRLVGLSRSALTDAPERRPA